MEKTPRYTQRERNMVLGFAAQYKDIIENKRTDAESNRKKDEVWRVIAKEFNSRVYHQRTAKQLRQLYKNMKLLLKKDLSIDGRTKDFMDILNALSQQSVLNPFITTSTSSSSYRQNHNNTIMGGGKSEYDENEHEQKVKIRIRIRKKIKVYFILFFTLFQGTSSSITSDQVENDVVVIKSEELSDNEQSSSVRNDMNDDTMSNKDIPEICMEEDDEYLMNDLNNDMSSYNKPYNHNGGNNNGDPATGFNFNNHNNNNNNRTNNEHCNSLLQLAIEERKRKIDLLNAQIEYWKALTRKLENTNSNGNTNSSNTTANNGTPNCHCHLQRINGVNQSQSFHNLLSLFENNDNDDDNINLDFDFNIKLL